MAERPTLDRLESVLENRTTRVLLVVLIILSVLPFREVEEALWPLFVLVFGVELGARIALMTDPKHRSLFDWILLSVDVAAFISFLPLETLLGELVTPFRLARLLLLLRFARALAEDVYSVMTRREQVQQFGLVTVAVLAMAFASAVVLSVFHVHDREDPNLNVDAAFWDRMWWSFRQIESPDNLVGTLDVHPVIAVLSLTLTITGVFVVSFIIGLGANVVGQVVRAERRRPVPFRGHTTVIGAIDEGEHLVREFVRIYDKNRGLRRFRFREVWDWLFNEGPRPRRHALPRMALLGLDLEPPDYLYEKEMRWVVYRHGHGANRDDLGLVAAQHAKRAILLADPKVGHDADGVTVATAAAFRERNPGAHLFAEVLESDNVDLVRSVGGTGAFPLDVPQFLGRFLVHHLVIPGVEAIYQELLTAEGSELYTHIYIEPREVMAVARLAAKKPTVGFADLARDAREHGVLLIGVLLGDGEFGRTGRELIPIDRLEQVLNPLHSGEDVPVRRLRGLVGVAESYLPMRRYARRLLRKGWSDRPPKESERPSLLPRLSLAAEPLRRVLVVGYSPAIGALLSTLARFVPGVHVVVVLSARGDDRTSLDERVQALQLGLDGREPGTEGIEVALNDAGASAQVFTREGTAVTDFAIQRLEGAVDAAVFLSDPDSEDRDARTLLRVLRFARALERGEAPRGTRLHLLAEFSSEQRGQRLEEELERRRCGFAETDDFRVTLLSTDRLKNYFMVYSAFVPGVLGLYEELLRPEGHTVVRLDLAGGSGSFRLGDAADDLASSGCIPLGVEMKTGEILLQPPAERRFLVSEVVGLFVVGDVARVHAAFGEAGLPSLLPSFIPDNAAS